MKIMHLLAPADAGGLERVVHSLAVGQHRSGHRVLVVPVVERWNPDHTFATPLERAGVEVRPLEAPPRGYLRERAAFARILGEVAPDVVHSHGYHTDVVDGEVARRAGVATVSTAHGFTKGPWRNRLYEWLDTRALKRFHAVVAVSRSLAELLRGAGVPADRVHVVPNSWSQTVPWLDRDSARRELGLPPDQFVIGWVGRMSHEKGLDVLLDSLALLADLPVTACVIGAGPERDPQEARAFAMGMADRISWAGLVREAGRCFHAFDVLVLSSRTEGVPMVIMEAMAAGVPIVATGVGGIPDVISQQEAFLVPPERPDALAAAVRTVFSNRDSAAERAAMAMDRLKRENDEALWLGRYENVYLAARGIANRSASQSRSSSL